MQLQGIVIYKHHMIHSYFVLKPRLLTSGVVGIETYTVKAALQQCKSTAAARRRDAVRKI